MSQRFRSFTKNIIVSASSPCSRILSNQVNFINAFFKQSPNFCNYCSSRPASQLPADKRNGAKRTAVITAFRNFYISRTSEIQKHRTVAAANPLLFRNNNRPLPFEHLFHNKINFGQISITKNSVSFRQFCFQQLCITFGKTSCQKNFCIWISRACAINSIERFFFCAFNKSAGIYNYKIGFFRLKSLGKPHKSKAVNQKFPVNLIFCTTVLIKKK